MTDSKTGIYINGKEQALEILKLLSPNERNRILSSISLKNPSLASELKRNSISSKDIEEYTVESFLPLFRFIKPEILGLAIKNTNKNFQREILRSAPRDYAEKAFQALMLEVPLSKKETISRAKNLLVQEISKLNQ